MSRRLRLGASLALLVLVLVADARAAYYGRGATVVSASLQRQELADDRSVAADVSRNGRYVAFDTRATNFFADDDPDPQFVTSGGPVATDRLGGIFRRDLDTGAVELVADGDVVAESGGSPLALGAHNASISADGRFVAFATAQRLVPADSDAPRDIDVYVRDMSRRICRPLPDCEGNPYELVSALDGTDAPLTYRAPLEPQPEGSDGSNVWPGTAISNDGRRVVFRTVVASDAPGPPDAAPGAPTVAGGQLLLRDLPADRTYLVTRGKPDDPDDAGRPVGGALGAAAISGDGTTIAWPGFSGPAQARFQPGEASDARTTFYLWRRFESGAFGAARRITGATDTDDPGCAPGEPVDFNDQASTAPCYGPLATFESERAGLSNVALSDDGTEVAFLTASGPRPGPTFGSGADLWTTSMRAGRSRKTASAELTRDGVSDMASGAGIEGVAMSPDGRYLAVATARTTFLLPALRLLPPARTRPTNRDLYLVDRRERTIQRIVTSAGGGDPDGDVDVQPSVSEGARRIAFVSTAANLFRGDANDRADAFVVTEQPLAVELAPPSEPPVAETPPAVGDVIPEPPSLAVRVLKGSRTGEMVLEVRPPATGRLAATVSARLPGRDGKRKASTPVTSVARTSARARARQRVRLTVKLAKRSHVALLRRLKRLPTSAEVSFTPAAAGDRSLRRRVTVRFVVVKKAKAQTRPSKPPVKKR